MRIKDRKMLTQFMAYKKMTIRDLAKAAQVSRSTAGHLHSGKRRNCTPETARAIEEALGAPSGLLFEHIASRVSRETSKVA